jgi:hypothetical protein
MRMTLMASVGKGRNNLVAVDNVIIKMSNNTNATATKSSEPRMKIKEKVSLNPGTRKLPRFGAG